MAAYVHGCLQLLIYTAMAIACQCVVDSINDDNFRWSKVGARAMNLPEVRYLNVTKGDVRNGDKR